MTSVPRHFSAVPSELPEGWTQETEDRILTLLPHDYHDDAANIGLLIVRGGIDPDDRGAVEALFAEIPIKAPPEHHAAIIDAAKIALADQAFISECQALIELGILPWEPIHPVNWIA
jgi:hypothetical protein